ncbi:MAG: YkgJ family cysteine cluster protein [Syntrophobacteraceae bacterium]|nr:YkgJ family cysteine cluster protein [Syntrophobacteraceae bacterium]
MTERIEGPPGQSISHPSLWGIDQFEANWSLFMETLRKEEASLLIPWERIRWQIEHCEVYQEVHSNWETLDPGKRLDSWKRLLVAAEEACRTVLPVCVRCGQCCRMGSPTLHEEDLPLVKEGKIAWEHLIALRKGEPARSPFDEKPFILCEERIKLAEKEGTRECVFLSSEGDRCAIYSDRPLQCRAQGCWDPLPARDTAELPFLLRSHIFEAIEVLLEVIAEHESRCGFQALSQAFEELGRSKGENIEQVLKLLSYEDHFRRFVSEKFGISPQYLDLLLGRSFSRMAALFGFRVLEEPDGSRRLFPEGPGA